MSRYIIYQADTMDAPGWERRKHVNGDHEAFTAVLAEQFDSTGGLLPQVGDRLTEYVHVPAFADNQLPQASTHYRAGDWEITQVEEYTSGAPASRFESIVVCVCRYAPIASELYPLDPVQVSADSFGDDLEAYEAWKQSELISS